MIVRDIADFHDIDLDSLKYIGCGYYGSVYRCGDKALKIFHSKDSINMLEQEHHRHFLDFLIKLGKIESPILLNAKEVFKNDDNHVEGYITNFSEGIRLDTDFGDMDINILIKALINFYQELVEIKDLVLFDASEYNLILGNELKIIDLDLAQFSYNLDYYIADSVKENIHILNVSIFRSIIKQNLYRGELSDVNLREIVREILTGASFIPDLLKEYIDYINNHYFEVKKVKDLRYPYVGRI